MATMYCALCQRPVEARRHMGGGTIIVGVISAGLSLIALILPEALFERLPLSYAPPPYPASR